MDEYQSYVYYHVDPVTDEIVYIGSGQYDRAWCIRINQRNAEHVEWIESLYELGFTAEDFVVIEQKRLPKKVALDEEKKAINRVKPRFNSISNVACLKLTEDEVGQAKQLRSTGISYKEIAELLGYSTMTIYRLLTKQTKGYTNGLYTDERISELHPSVKVCKVSR